MKFLKEKKGIIISFIIGVILASGVVYAATSASQITYTTNKNEYVKTVEDALNDLYTNSKFSIPSVVWNGGDVGWVYGWIDLPDLTKYKELSIDSISLITGNFQYARLIDNSNNILNNFILSNSKQTFNIENYIGTGYRIELHSSGMGKNYSELKLTNLVLK